ncbi:MAG: hypothetical protein IKB64_09975 [Paludibacteraceae bacterium]|nr:hypothetical protein [Paludibacteraceae bacterium]
MSIKSLCYVVLNLCSLYCVYTLVKIFVYPKILDLFTTEIERNPSWLAEKLRSEYYGYNDIDFILCECSLCRTPRFRVLKNSDRLELLIPNDFTIWDRDKIAKIALMGKIKIKHGLLVQDKPVYWLSIFCYLLDGGDINVSETKWEEKDDNSEKRQENS